MPTLNRTTGLIAGGLALAMVVALFFAFRPGGDKITLTADFPRAVSLYEGSDVRILGVGVGKVEKVTPVGTKVRVRMAYDGKYDVPADAKAAVVSPSVVGDRFVQLTPAYTGGDKMQSGAKLGIDRTAMPLELDEIFGSLNDLNKALGPDGANKADEGGIGPLTRLLDSTARNFGGQGVEFNKTIKNFGAFTKTLADNKDALFGTLSKVQDFTSTLKKNDTTVRQFNDSLAAGANVLAGEREELAAVLRDLSVAMVQIRGFIKENRGRLTSNIAGLNRISKTLVKRRAELDEVLRVAPAALNNLYLAGNTRNGTLDTRSNQGELLAQLEKDPAAVLCTIVRQSEGGDEACSGIEQLFAGAPRPAALVGDGSTPTRVVEPIDRSMGGLLEVAR